MLCLKDSTLIKVFKRMEHMNTSITQDLLELIVPTAVEWDQLLPETQHSLMKWKLDISAILVKKRKSACTLP